MKLNAMKNVDYSFQGSRESDFIEKILQVRTQQLLYLFVFVFVFFCGRD